MTPKSPLRQAGRSVVQALGTEFVVPKLNLVVKLEVTLAELTPPLALVPAPIKGGVQAVHADSERATPRHGERDEPMRPLGSGPATSGWDQAQHQHQRFKQRNYLGKEHSLQNRDWSVRSSFKLRAHGYKGSHNINAALPPHCIVFT